MFLKCEKFKMSMRRVVKVARRKSRLAAAERERRLVAAMHTVYGDDTVPVSPTVGYINSFRQAQYLLEQQHMLMPASACADRGVRFIEGAIHAVEKRSALAHRRGRQDLCVSLDMPDAGGWPVFVKEDKWDAWDIEDESDDVVDAWLAHRRACMMAQMQQEQQQV